MSLKQWQQEAIDLAKSGMSWRKVAYTLGVPRTTVSDFLRKTFRKVKLESGRADTSTVRKEEGLKIAVVADTQCKPGVDLSYMTAIGNYLADKKPDVIVHIGDHWDFPSLSSYDKGKAVFEGRRVVDDLEAGKLGMELLLAPIKSVQEAQRASNKKVYNPRMVFTVGNHECLTPDTEVLTRTGYKNISQISEDDEVLTMLPDGVTSEWNKPTRFIAKHHEGYIHKYESRSFSLHCTPSHRVYYKSNGKLFVKESKDVPENFSIPTSAHLIANGVDYSDDELRLAAWLCTDSFHSNFNVLTLYQRESKSHLIRDVLNRLGIHFVEAVRDRDIKEICGKVLLKRPEPSHEFRINKQHFSHLRVENNFSLPDWCESMTSTQWDVFLGTLIEADGTIPTRATTSRVFYGKKRICDDVQRYASMHGWSASLTEYRGTQWRVNLCKRTYRKQEALKKVVEEYDGMVYCLEVKNSNFMVRHNNKAHFTGNCRFDRLANDTPELKGLVGVETIGLEDMGWEVYPFLKPCVIEDIHFVHYLANPFTGKPYGGSALSQLKNVGVSFVVGHKQILDVAMLPTLDGKMRIGLINGSCYDFDESYKGYQNNNHFRGLTMLHEVKDGFGLPSFASLDYIVKKYS